MVKNLILEELIIQHPDMARMNPAAVNTIRVITMLDRNAEVHIIETQAKCKHSIAFLLC